MKIISIRVVEALPLFTQGKTILFREGRVLLEAAEGGVVINDLESTGKNIYFTPWSNVVYVQIESSLAGTRKATRKKRTKKASD